MAATAGDVRHHGAQAERKKNSPSHNDSILAGFAGSRADSFALFSRTSKSSSNISRQLERAAVELARDWRTDRLLRRLEAMLLVSDTEIDVSLSGTGDLIEPDDGSWRWVGGPFAMAAARGWRATASSIAPIAVEAMAIAADIGIYPNPNLTIEEL